MKQFLYWAFLQNVWLWFHILTGGLAAKLGLLLLPGKTVMLIIIAVAAIWEIGEFLYMAIAGTWPYESLRHFIADAFGDISGATMMAGIVII